MDIQDMLSFLAVGDALRMIRLEKDEVVQRQVATEQNPAQASLIQTSGRLACRAVPTSTTKFGRDGWVNTRYATPFFFLLSCFHFRLANPFTPLCGTAAAVASVILGRSCDHTSSFAQEPA